MQQLLDNPTFTILFRQNQQLTIPVGPAIILDTCWKIQKFGLFQPDLPIDEQHPDGDIITIDRDTIYRNIDVFC